MRVPLSGILTGFRIRESGTTKDRSEYGYLDILQTGNKDFDSSLTHVVVQDADLISYFLTHYSSGQLHWIDLLCHQVRSGKDDVWLLIKVFKMMDDPIEVGVPAESSGVGEVDRAAGAELAI